MQLAGKAAAAAEQHVYRDKIPTLQQAQSKAEHKHKHASAAVQHAPKQLQARDYARNKAEHHWLPEQQHSLHG